MATLHTLLRSKLERAVVAAREEAERAARAALAVLAVEESRPFEALDGEQRTLRNALRAEARRLGERSFEIGFPLLVDEIAYQQWHRMLFARFLAERGLLLHPAGVALTLDDCRALAAEEGSNDAWEVAARFAAAMLPGLFPLDHPAVQIRFAPEGQRALERILDDLPEEVFTSDDGLGWVYQFWQKKKKDEVNASGRKIGGADLSPVTQLFTEPYMVRFLLENSLGAWWAARHPESPLIREWDYLRFWEDGSPAAGRFETWPERVAEVTVLDPCCGSGHFLVAAFGMLVAMRMEEEGLTRAEAADRVLHDNLFGLELDPRCTQIATFAVALAAWEAGGDPKENLPQIACSGIPVRGQLDDWIKLAKGDARLQFSLEQLHKLFEDAPTLGSLIDPRQIIRTEDLFSVSWERLADAIERAVKREAATDSAAALLGRSAADAAHAALLLGRTYTLVVTNVPYLTRQNQAEALRRHIDRYHAFAKADLATVFLDRSSKFVLGGGSIASISPQGWFYLGSYLRFRQDLLVTSTFNIIARLGPRAFESISGEVVNVVLVVNTSIAPSLDSGFEAIDVSGEADSFSKRSKLKSVAAVKLTQREQLVTPDSRLFVRSTTEGTEMKQLADSVLGLGTGDYPRYKKSFWEVSLDDRRWQFLQDSPASSSDYAGREHVVFWDLDKEQPYGLSDQERIRAHNQEQRGRRAWGRTGVVVGLMRAMPTTLYTGDRHDKAVSVLLPDDPELVAPLWVFCESGELRKLVHEIEHGIAIANGALEKVRIDLEHWQKVAAEKYPNGLPEPYSNDPTQWLFAGMIPGAEHPLQVAVARLLGYRWPDQVDDAATPHADADGIVPLLPLRGELPAAERLRRLLEAAYGDDWLPALLDRLLADAGFGGKSLAEWLDARNGFFAQHVKLFQNRPFIWQIHDGQKGGFSVLVNYHTLTAEKLDRLIHSYLGEWIEQQRAAAGRSVTGADARLKAAQELRSKLLLIQEGEPPYDIYVRWKPLAEQPVGWNPDLNDGVRLNIRPFITAGSLRAPVNVNWKKDRGANPPGSDAQRWAEEAQLAATNRKELSSTNGSERLNDLHLTNAVKRAAREALTRHSRNPLAPGEGMVGGSPSPASGEGVGG